MPKKYDYTDKYGEQKQLPFDPTLEGFELQEIKECCIFFKRDKLTFTYNHEGLYCKLLLNEDGVMELKVAIGDHAPKNQYYFAKFVNDDVPV